MAPLALRFATLAFCSVRASGGKVLCFKVLNARQGYVF
jgi:hypothetical protein